jgi:hypothetical protein
MGSLSRAELKLLVARVRELTGARFVLLVPEEFEGLEALSAELGSSAVPVRVLLREPLRALWPDAPLEAPLPVAPARTLDTLGVDDLLDLDLELEPVSRPYVSRHSPRPTPQPVQAHRVPDALEALISDELDRFSSDSGIRTTRLVVTLDVTSDSTLLADASGAITGVFVATLFPQPVGLRARLQVSLPWGEQFEVEGVVAFEDSGSVFRSRRKPGIGVRVVANETFTRAATRFAALRAPMRHEV